VCTALFPLPPGEGWGEGRVLAKALPTSVGAHPVRNRNVSTTSAVAHWVRSYRERTPLFAPVFDLPSPMPRVGGRWISPQGGRQDAGQGIVRAGGPVDPPRLSSATLQGRGIGVAFLLVTSLDSGHPALRPAGRLRRSHGLLRVRGHAKRSDPLVGRRAEARRRRATWRYRDNRRLTSLGPGLRRDDEHGDRGERRSRTGCAPPKGRDAQRGAQKNGPLSRPVFDARQA